MQDWYCMRGFAYRRLFQNFSGTVLLLLTSPAISAVNDNFFSYLGGSLSDTAYDSGLDAQGNLFTIGQTLSSTIVGINTVFSSTTQDQNCFISKINPVMPQQNQALITGGSEQEVCRKILIDTKNNIYIIGETRSMDFPVTNNSRLRGEWDGFLVKYDNNLNLLFASYLGGSNTDFAHGMAFYGPDKIAIVGETWSTDFPTTSNAFVEDCQQLKICDAEYANAYLYITDTENIATPLYSTYLGGIGNDKAHSVSSSGNLIVVGGETQSTDFPLINQLSNVLKGNLDAFVALFEFSTDASANLIFSSYLGGNGEDSGQQIRFDRNKNIILSGESSSDDFPTTANAISQRCAFGYSFCQMSTTSSTDIFISQIDSRQYQLAYSTLLGGSQDETPSALIITDDNHWWLSGETYSEDFPVTDNAQKKHCTNNSTCLNQSDGFIIKLNPALNAQAAVIYSSYFGGDDSDSIINLQLNDQQLVLSGNTNSAITTTNLSVNSTPQNGDAFVAFETVPAAGKLLTKPHPGTKTKSINRSSLNPSVLLCLYLLIAISRRKCTPGHIFIRFTKKAE